jgi:uncharacterized protein YciI
MPKQFMLSVVFALFALSLLCAQEKDADKTVMKNYFMVFLKKGPNRNQDSLEVEKLQMAHLYNITKLHAEGKLVLAGPFLDDGDIRGIFVFDVPTLEEVKKLVETDPAVISGRLSYEVHPWMTQQGACLK